jgi:hypothetical protein
MSAVPRVLSARVGQIGRAMTDMLDREAEAPLAIRASGRPTPRGGVPLGAMARPIHPSLAPPGNEAEWAKINREEERQEAEFAASLSIPERLEFGQRLCDQAFEFYNAVHAGHGPRRDPRA